MFKTCKRNVMTAFSQNVAMFLPDEADTSAVTTKRSASSSDGHDDDDSVNKRCKQPDTVQPLPASTSYQGSTLSDQPQLDSTPLTNQPTRCCTNCGVYTIGCDVGICARCLALPFCTGCKRHLQPGCFDQPSHLCQSCARRRKAPHVTTALENVLTQADVPVTAADTSFDVYIANNAQHISNFVKQYQQRLK